MNRDKKELFKRLIVYFWERKFTFVPRELSLPLDINLIITIVGPRRAGKTYRLFQLASEFWQKFPKKYVIYLNLEDERLMPLETTDGELFLEAYYEIFPQGVNISPYLLLDEIQELPGWSKFLRRIHEEKRAKVYITGSSAKLLSREIATELRGRTLAFSLYPFSFREYLLWHGFKKEDFPLLSYSEKRFQVKKLFNDYLLYGGFPEIFNQEPSLKIRILQDYFDLIFYRDIIERFHIKNLFLMKDLMRYIAHNFARLFSVRKYHALLSSRGIKTSKNTIFEYLGYLEEINLLKLVPLFSFSFKKQLVNPRKVYIIDNGLVTATAFPWEENRGFYLENIVFIELLRRGGEIFYYKTLEGFEVDFLVWKENKIYNLIQVTQTLGSKETLEREKRALISAMSELNVNKAIILTEDESMVIEEDKFLIEVKPIWLWLLELPRSSLSFTPSKLLGRNTYGNI